MNRKLSLSALALLAAAAAGPALADAEYFPGQPFTSSRSRAEVIAELQDFRRSGIDPWADNYDMMAGFHSGRTRAEVTAEYLGDRQQIDAMNAEGSGVTYVAQRNRVLASPVFIDTPVEGTDIPVVAGQPQNAGE